jgi:hypothetical protein
MNNYEYAKKQLDTNGISYDEIGNNSFQVGNIRISLNGDFIDIFKGKKDKWVMNGLFDQEYFIRDINEFIW